MSCFPPGPLPSRWGDPHHAHGHERSKQVVGWIVLTVAGFLLLVVGAVLWHNEGHLYDSCEVVNRLSWNIGSLRNCSGYHAASVVGLVLFLLGIAAFLTGGLLLLLLAPTRGHAEDGHGPHHAPPGFYPDPMGVMRWWDGNRWTSTTQGSPYG